MNEQKMIDLVNKIADNDKVSPFQNGFVVLTNEEMVKFAELIVRECAGICDDYGMPDGTSPTAIILSAAIKKRFGIKE